MQKFSFLLDPPKIILGKRIINMTYTPSTQGVTQKHEYSKKFLDPEIALSVLPHIIIYYIVKWTRMPLATSYYDCCMRLLQLTNEVLSWVTRSSLYHFLDLFGPRICNAATRLDLLICSWSVLPTPTIWDVLRYDWKHCTNYCSP